MKLLQLTLFALLVSASTFAQQQVLLITESFENGAGIMDFTTGGVGTNSGSNSWIVNNAYNGSPLYANTPRQDSVISGTINNAPFSNYLHIHDQGAVISNGISNANWNTSNASDRFCFINRPFCTLGLSDVIFTFFWTCEGNNNAYGQVYYRIDGGPWIATGLPKYNSQNKWKYEVIQDPAFNNVQNLQIGFRWVNPGGGGSSNVSFGIDDIIAVGSYNSNTNPVSLTINSVQPNPVCQDNFIVVSYSLSQPLCTGEYSIRLSSRNGIFSNNSFNAGNFYINAPDTTGAIGFYAPRDSAGNCFRIQITRLSPLPTIVSQVSDCFTIIDCPETINTLNAPVMNDLDTTCILSVIDVKFNSFGVFGPNNRYIAQLSDANGSFANPTQLGVNVTRNAFPAQPGTVSGLIPASVPPGCGYRIRIISTSPSVVGTTIGPFCLVQCDVTTNNTQDLKFCIQTTNPYDSCEILNIRPNNWNANANYDTCNNWTIELHEMMGFGLVNTGGLGIYRDSIGGNFNLCMPSLPVLLSRGIQPGAYYMRIISNCSDQPWNQTGTVVRVTIGAPASNPPTIFTADTVNCGLGVEELFVNPFNHPPSDYEWLANGFNFGLPFIWEFNPLRVDLTNAPENDYNFRVREVNFGCYGPFSDPATIYVIGLPDVQISGPKKVCIGDTVTYNVDFLPETYYNWDAPSGVSILDEANSQVTIIFDSLGTYTFSNYTLNECGGDSGYYTVDVVSLYKVDAGADKVICAGQEVTLLATTDGYTKEFISQDTATRGQPGAMFNIIAHDDVVIDSIAVRYLSTAPVIAEVYRKNGTYRTFETNPGAWNLVGSYFNFTPSAIGQFTTIPVDVTLPMSTGDTMGFYITTANNINMAITPVLGAPGTLYKTDGVIDFIQGTANQYSFGAFVVLQALNAKIYYSTKAGLKYTWNTGDTTAQIILTPTQSGEYNLVMSDTSGCKAFDSVFVTVNSVPFVNAGTDTLICDGEQYLIPATSDATGFVWVPSVGLSNANILTPTFLGNSSQQYIVNVISAEGCTASDTLQIDVRNCLSYIEVPEAFTPNGDGVNDFFTLFGNNIANYEIQIYNRWGEMVFSSRDLSELSNLSKGWDGTYKGKEQNTGVFVYQLSATDVYGKSISKKGNLTLIR